MTRFRRRHARSALVGLVSVLMMIAGRSAQAEAGGGSPVLAAALASGPQQLYLDVRINDQPSNLIVQFAQTGEQLACAPEDLEQLGFLVRPEWLDAEHRVPLARIPGLRQALDILHMVLNLEVGAEQLQPHRYDANEAAALNPQADWGAALNYDFYGQWSLPESGGQVSGSQSGLLDLRLFGPLGRLSQTGVLRRQDSGQPRESAIRLDSRYSVSDVATLSTWNAGDLISGGNLGWTTPVRMAGLQLQRNFHLQPSFITFPVPSLDGAAAVPSTVDVYVNNTRQLSRAVEPGPFTIDNLPVVTGAGEVRLVVRDALGREQVIVRSFYAAPTLLREGLLDFSTEVGFLRHNYGTRSLDYGRDPAATASLRYGLTPGLTVEAHDEGTRGFVNGGAGTVANIGRAGVVSGFAAGSRGEGRSGAQVGGSYQFQAAGLGLFLSGSHGISRYQTLALHDQGGNAVRDNLQASVSTQLGRGSLSFGYSQFSSESALPAIAGLAPCTPLTVSCVSAEPATTMRSLTASYSTSLWQSVSFTLSAQRQLSTPKGYAASAGFSWFFDGIGTSLAADVARGGSARYLAQTGRSIPNEGTGGGWSLRGTAGADHQQAAAAGYRFAPMTAEAGVIRQRGIDNPYLDLRGSLVGIGGALHFANPVYDSFGLVDLGVPGVGVLYENRPVGSTDSRGQLFIPNLRSYERNKVTIKAEEVPPDVEVAAIEQIAFPRDQSGVVLRFPVQRENAAIVRLQLESGAPVPVGSEVRVVDSGASALAGFDGVAYLRHLQEHNEIAVRWRDGRCKARFDYRADPGQMVRIGPITCLQTLEQVRP